MTTASMANSGKALKQTTAEPINRPDAPNSSCRREEEKLRQTNVEIEHLLSSLSTILIGLSPDCRLHRWNAIAEKVFGVTAAEIMGKPLGDIDLQWDWDKIQQGMLTCRKEVDSVRIDDIIFARPDQKQGYLGFTINPICTDADNFSGFIIIGADITERKALENNLAQTEKLKSIGQLAAGIAHEINTPTQYVGDNTRFLQDAFRDILQILEQYEKLLHAVKSDGVTADLIREVEQDLEAADVDFLLEEIPAAIQAVNEGNIFRFFTKPCSVDMLGESLITGIEHYQRVTREREYNERTRISMAQAGEVQQHLIPKADPTIEGLDIAGKSIYCDETGGDYYDFLDGGGNGNTKISVVVGDVSEHGISSALLMTSARAFLRERSLKPGTIANIVSDVNKQLTRDIEISNRFMTLF